MKVLLVNTNLMKPVVAPIALDYLGAALEAKGFAVDTLDLAFANDFRKAIITYFKENSPDVIGITIRNTDDCYFTSQDFIIPQIKEIVEWLKKKSDAPIILGGVGFSVMPDLILNYLGLDLGIKGEGEEAFPLLLEKISQNESYLEVPGLVFRRGNGYFSNPPQFIDLSQFNFFRRSFINNERYYREGGMGNVETKRGCEKACIYCADPVGRGRKFRLRSPESAVDEIEALVSKKIFHFHFCDSEFNLPYEHAVDVCKEIIRRKLGKELAWYAYLSPTPFDLELARLMKKAGCAGVDFGVDSGSDEILKNLRRDFTSDDLVKVAKICHQLEIPFMYDLLLGGPGETRETVKETIALMRKIKPSRVGMAIGIRIYPETALGEMVQREGVTKDNPSLFGKVEGNENLFEPIYYISPRVGMEIISLAYTEVGENRSMFFAISDELGRNYNYNMNKLLVDAIKKGYRGAFWDILRRVSEGKK